VRCGAIGTKTYITDPLVVIEVLSPSTISTGSDPTGLTPGSNAGCGMGSDPQGLTPATLDFYKSLPTLRHIALIYQDQMRVEHYRRGEQGFELEVLKRADHFCISRPSNSASISPASTST
jgi:Uma2 family endonuclease